MAAATTTPAPNIGTEPATVPATRPPVHQSAAPPVKRRGNGDPIMSMWDACQKCGQERASYVWSAERWICNDCHEDEQRIAIDYLQREVGPDERCGGSVALANGLESLRAFLDERRQR